MHLFKTIYRAILPFICLLCGNYSDSEQNLCTACDKELPRIQYACNHCAIPLEEAGQAGFCGMCLRQAPPYTVAHSLFIYEMPMIKLILDLKFQDALVNGKLLGSLLAEHLQFIYQGKALPTLIIPMPLHRKRLKERGFNQALEIARPIAKQLRIPLAPHLCQRIKPTLAQATLSAKARQQNMRHAFSVSQPIVHPHIAVIDDVVTTGSTMNEFCRTLQKQGAKRIDVWCLARPRNAR